MLYFVIFIYIYEVFLPGHPEGLPTKRGSGQKGHQKMNGCKTDESMSTGSSGKNHTTRFCRLESTVAKYCKMFFRLNKLKKKKYIYIYIIYIYIDPNLRKKKIMVLQFLPGRPRGLPWYYLCSPSPIHVFSDDFQTCQRTRRASRSRQA